MFVHTLGAPTGPTKGSFALRAYEPSGLFGRLGASEQMKAGLDALTGKIDVVHSHGLWLRTDAYAARAARRGRAKLVVSPRGTLDPWAFRYHWLRKWPVWHAWQRRALREAACLHATAHQEYEFIRALGFSNPVAVVPNGAHIPEAVAAPDPAGPRKLLYLARIHPKKGVLNLVTAWAEVERAFPAWELHIAGADDGGHLAEVKREALRLGLQRCRLLGYVPEAQKEALIRSAQLYVLPTYNENWGVSVADALSYGVPAIVGRGAPWSGLNLHRCGWWVDNDTATLAATLREALATPLQELQERGLRGRAWIRAAFAWDEVGSMMEEVYQWVVEGGTPPPTVHLD